MTTLARSGPIHLGDAPQTIQLASVDSRIDPATASTVILMFTGMYAAEQPGVTYRVYLGSGATIPQDEAHYAGTINFFNAVPLPGARTKPEQPVELDVKPLSQMLRKGPIHVVLVPESAPNPKSMTEIGSIALVIR